MQPYDFMNAEEVAQYLHLGKNAVYQMAKSGELASYRVGRKLRFTMEDVEEYLNSLHQGKGERKRDSSVCTKETTLLRKADAQDSIPIIQAASFGTPDTEPFVIAGADQGADIIASELNASGTPASRMLCESYTALVNLYADEADAAVTSLYDQMHNKWNTSYVSSLAPGISTVVFRLYGVKQGFIVQLGNPKNISTWGSLLHEGVRLANRKRGSGARVLLDEKLRALEARAETIEGYTGKTYNASEAIARIACGAADVAIGSQREIQNASGVQFVPLVSSWTDIAVRKNEKTQPVIRNIKNMLSEKHVQDGFSNLAPCDASRLGAIVYES